MTYTKRQFASLFTISVKTLERYMFAGTCQYHRLGRRVFFTQEDLDNFLKTTACPAKKSLGVNGGAA